MKRIDGGFLGAIGSGMFAAWLDDNGPDGSSAGLDAALVSAPQGPVRLFASGWLPDAELLAELEAGHRERLLTACGWLGEGRAAVVVTGQQPGFLGGPLYTLHKIVTAVVLARIRSRNGLPTVPVFWSADDDTDLAEVLSAVAWLPGEGRMVRSGGREHLRLRDWQRRTAGSLPSAVLHGTFAGAIDGGEAGSWYRLLVRANAKKWNLSRFLSVFWSRLFASDGLIVLSGDDPRLHEAAGDLTAVLRPRTEELGDLVRRRGEQLLDSGGHVQLGERSLRRPWYRSDGVHRVPLARGEEAAPSSLRPGVLMRSPIQDWLLDPVAVVAGPGEFAYLKQLEPLYAAVGIPRRPLVPRLSGTVAPPGVAPADLVDTAGDREPVRLSAEFLDDAEERLRRLMSDELGLDEDRSRALAAGRVRRWRKGLAHMLTAQAREMRTRSGPPWLAPLGRPQERSLAVMGALLLWGDPWLQTVEAAAAEHLEQGAAGRWRSFLFALSAEGGDA